MERQKIFWVVLSVSVFVVVVLVVGAFLLRPRPSSSTETPVTVSPLSDQGTQVYEYQVPAGSPGASGASGATSSSGQSGNTETLHFYIGEGQGEAGSGPAPSSTSPAAPSVQGETTTTTAPEQVPGTVPQGAAAVTRAPAPRTAPAAAAAAKPAVKPTARSTEYWIQTGSYKSQTRAEDLAALLGDKGLAGRVFSYAVQGATWYRVRVGPYTSKGEANKFLAEVKKLQGLETSFVSQVGPAKPPVN
jgi:DedD protein